MTAPNEGILVPTTRMGGRLAGMNPSCVVLYASYPKVGSSMIPDALERLKLHSRFEIERFSCLGGKNNFLITRMDRQGETLLLKTHETLGRWIRFLQKRADAEPEVIRVLRAIGLGSEDLFDNGKLKIVYLIRNPFNTLLSAIRYVKNLLQRPGLLEQWQKDERAERLFIKLLGLKALPTADHFQSYSVLELPEHELEVLLWRYLESGASIPAFEEAEKPGYFAHVNYFATLLESGFDGVLLNYEGLMAQDTTTIGAIASLLGVPSMKLREALGAEIEEKVVRRSSRNNFYGDFKTRTPEKIVKLRSWPEMKRYVSAACPSLADLC